MLSAPIVAAVRRHPSPAPTFTPPNLGAALLCYLDFEDNTKITLNAGACASIQDSVTPADVWSAAAGVQPVIGASAFTGRQVAKFTGVENLIIAPVPAQYPLTGACELWWLGANTDLAANRAMVSFGVGVASGTLQLLRLTSTFKSRFSAGDGTSNLFCDSINIAPGNGFMLARGIVTATQAISELNGMTGNSIATVRSTNNTRVRLGANAANTVGSQWIGECSFFAMTQPLTQQQANQMYVFAFQRSNGQPLTMMSAEGLTDAIADPFAGTDQEMHAGT
jgi:hypothetical protein